MNRIILVILLLGVSILSFGQITSPNPNWPGGDRPHDGEIWGNPSDSTDFEVADTTGGLIKQNTDTISFVKVVREFNLDLERSIPAFSLDDVHQYQPVFKSELPSQNLGVNGSPVYDLTYQPTYFSDMNWGMNTHNAYLKDNEDVRYYRAERPFTKLLYVTGARRENKFAIEHTQNWGRGLNIGANYESLVSQGFYFNQAINVKNLDAHVWFQSKNKKFNTLFHYINNKFINGMNGGIVPNVNYFEFPDFNNRQSIPTKLSDAQKLYKQNIFHLQNSYDLGQSLSVKINDTISDTQLVPRFRFQHRLESNQQTHNFSSNDFNLFTQEYFENTYINDTLKTADLAKTKQISNEFRLKWLGNKLGADSTLVRQNFLGDVYSRFSNYDVSMLRGYQKKFNDLLVGGSLRSNPLDTAIIVYKVEGEYHIIDRRAGDYKVRGEAGFNFNNVAGDLIGFIELNNQEQPFFAQEFYQSHYQFNQELPKLNARTIGGKYHNPLLNATASVQLVNASNLLYYNTKRQPTIDRDAETYLLAHLHKELNWKKFQANLNGYYQTASDTETIQKPQYIGYGDVFYKGPLFKNNVMAKIGFNTRWQSKNYLDDYDPSLGEFFRQNKFEYENNPQVGFFTNFSLSRARIFLRLDHINQPLSSKHPIMLAHNRPQHDFAFRMGINWIFVN